jgi:hypothetical protein
MKNDLVRREGMQYYIEKLNHSQFGLLLGGRIVAVFESFDRAKLAQLDIARSALQG